MTVAKAIVGSILAGLSALGTALIDGQVVALEWVAIATAVLGTFYGVWQVPNAVAGKHEPKSGVVAYDPEHGI